MFIVKDGVLITPPTDAELRDAAVARADGLPEEHRAARRHPRRGPRPRARGSSIDVQLAAIDVNRPARRRRGVPHQQHHGRDARLPDRAQADRRRQARPDHAPARRRVRGRGRSQLSRGPTPRPGRQRGANRAGGQGGDDGHRRSDRAAPLGRGSLPETRRTCRDRTPTPPPAPPALTCSRYRSRSSRVRLASRGSNVSADASDDAAFASLRRTGFAAFSATHPGRGTYFTRPPTMIATIPAGGCVFWILALRLWIVPRARGLTVLGRGCSLRPSPRGHPAHR